MKPYLVFAAAAAVVIAFACAVGAGVYYSLQRPPEPEPKTCSAEFERRGVKYTVTWDDPRLCNRLAGPPSAPNATTAPPQQ